MQNNYGKEDFKAFAYLDYDNPIVAWNIAKGWFYSPKSLPKTEYKKEFLSIMTAGMLSNSTPNRMASELAIESIRKKFFPECVSRLDGFFVFDEIESIERFWNSNNWGGHFSDKYLSDVGVAANSSTKVDSNWIGEIVDKNGNLTDGWILKAKKYWRGEPFLNKPPIWEKIIDGYLTVWSNNIRQEAMYNIQSIWPNSMELFHYACLCSKVGSYDCQVMPYLMKNNDQSLKIAYIMSLKDYGNSDFIKNLLDKAKNFKFINFDIKYNTNEESTFPDLRGFEVVFSKHNKMNFLKLIEEMFSRFNK